MFSHNKRLQYTLRVSETHPGLANLMLEQFGGAQGELPGKPEFTSVYFDMSKGNDVKGPWNDGPAWEVVSDPEDQMAVDGGAELGMSTADALAVGGMNEQLLKQ